MAILSKVKKSGWPTKAILVLTSKKPNKISVLKLVKNEVSGLRKILGLGPLFCQNSSHLGFDRWMTLNRKNNHTNNISEPKLVENKVLHNIIALAIFFQKLPFYVGLQGIGLAQD